jgi:endopeptidase La
MINDSNFTKKMFYEHLFAIEFIENKNYETLNPFGEIKEKIVSIGKSYGFNSIDNFLKLYINDQYHYLLSDTDNEIIDIYNKVFIPIKITIKKQDQDQNYGNIMIKKILSDYDNLIDNTCNIMIYVDKISTQFIFSGYISSDILNIYVRTSQIYSKYIFKVKKEFEQIIKNKYPDIEPFFYSRYIKMINGHIYFVNSPNKNAKLFKDAYDLYISLSTKGTNNIVKIFLQSDIKTMFNIINLLLMGNDQMIYVATLLYDSLQEKRNNKNIISDIIYRNLSFNAQNKLTVLSSDMKSEINKVKAMTIDNIPIEKKIAIMVDMPDNVKAYIMEKTQEIKSGENNYKLQSAINGLMQFPWKPRNFENEYENIRESMIKSRNYLRDVESKLNISVYGHENSKKTLIELVGKWIYKPESSGQVIGLVGPPGVGKTLLAKSISQALNIPFAIVGLGGMNDSSDLIGHNFTYANAQYGMIIRQMINAGSWRSMLFFDEVDKVSKRNDTNEIYNTLIHITDPNMNQHFQDRFYSSAIDFDLSGTLIVFSYNNSDLLDPILLDRIREIPISAYSTKEKIEIAKNHIIRELTNEIGFPSDKIIFSEEIIRYIIEKYTHEAGVRELRRKIEQILMKINIDRYYMRGPFIDLMHSKYIELHNNSRNKSGKNIVLDIKDHNKLESLLSSENVNQIFNFKFDGVLEIDIKIVHMYLDEPTLMIEKIHNKDLVGMINGLYATNIGIGGIVFIQIEKRHAVSSDNDNNKTNFELKMTGNQKQVMKESVDCAFTVALNLLGKKNIIEKYPNGFHIHASDGGTPKDGPSAGCAFATAFVSILLGKKINKNVAMTGEIDLTGKINKIGGLSAKLIGAKKAGVKRVYICKDNKSDYETMKKKDPTLFDDTFEIKIIEHIIEIVSDPYVIPDISTSDFKKKYLNNIF